MWLGLATRQPGEWALSRPRGVSGVLFQSLRLSRPSPLSTGWERDKDRRQLRACRPRVALKRLGSPRAQGPSPLPVGLRVTYLGSSAKEISETQFQLLCFGLSYAALLAPGQYIGHFYMSGPQPQAFRFHDVCKKADERSGHRKRILGRGWSFLETRVGETHGDEETMAGCIAKAGFGAQQGARE